MEFATRSSPIAEISDLGKKIAELHSEDALPSPSADSQPNSIRSEKDYDFLEPPPPEFFCPVNFEFLVDPQQTTCCGNHLSCEAALKLQEEGRACPMCNEPNLTTVPDKHYKRRCLDFCVRCPHDACGWVGEIRGYQTHLESCVKRPWECQHCGLSCTHEEGEDHLPACNMFPIPCPNGCEVGTVERGNLVHHSSVCSLEPVACQMSEYGCSAIVPRKDLATHMEENKIQHVTSIALLNLSLSRQLQEDLAKKDVKIAQLQQSVLQLQQELQIKMKDVSKQMQRVQTTVGHIEDHTARGSHTLCKVITFDQYSHYKKSGKVVDSDPFISHYHGYKLQFRVTYYSTPFDAIVCFLCILPGEYDDELQWPVKIKLEVEQLNQAADQSHVMVTTTLLWDKAERESWKAIDDYYMKYDILEKREHGMQYMMNDSLKFRLHITPLVPRK